MALDTVLFKTVAVTMIDVAGQAAFLARLFAGDVTKIPVGGVQRCVMLNASGGVIDTVLVARMGTDAYKLFLTGAKADAREAWIRQVSVAFDAEPVSTKLSAFHFVGEIPVKELSLAKGQFCEKAGVILMNLGWTQLVVGEAASVAALFDNLVSLGAKIGADAGLTALRILAREPEPDLEFDESTSPLEAGLEDCVDFSDTARIFIGRALTEARFEAKKHEKLQLVAFDFAFEPETLTESPLIVSGDLGYELTSIVRLPEMPLTVGLVRLPYGVAVGDKLKCIVKTDPVVSCPEVLVIEPQV